MSAGWPLAWPLQPILLLCVLLLIVFEAAPASSWLRLPFSHRWPSTSAPHVHQRQIMSTAAGSSPASATSALVAYTSINQFVHAPKPCAAGCEQHGNCNAETGTCECPWGRGGAACEVDRLSLCHVNPANPTVPSCGLFAPKNCECYHQCAEFYCYSSPTHPTNAYPENCAHELSQKYGEGRCYLYYERDPHEQVSVLPDPNATVPREKAYWIRLPHSHPKDWPGGLPRDFLEKRLEFACWNGWSTWDYMVYVQPQHLCPNKCSDRGMCARNPDKSYCICRKGFKGEACEEEDPEEACWFAPTCNGHGSCKSGFCHCEKGWWGIGCGRSQALAVAPGSHAVHSRTRLRIYVYDLPSHIAFPGEFDDGSVTRDRMYTAYEYFQKYLLADWSVRTENPLEANLFYVPAYSFFYSGNVRSPIPHLHRVVDYISSEFPYWNRSKGKDHFWFLTGDQGACSLSEREGYDRLVDHPIKVVHFGLSGRRVEWRHRVDPDYACLRPERDVVVPPVADYAIAKSGDTARLFEFAAGHGGSDNRTRHMLFFFAGGVNMHDKFVSGYARQALMLFLQDKNFSDVLVKEGRVHNYEEMFLTSKFCIAPYGYGWGLRLAIAVVHGCIPVIIQDQVWQPFEELLPYHEFSVRIQVKDVPQIVDILRSYSDEQINAMRLALSHHWAAFVWPHEGGGRAYNYTIEALKHRMHNHAAEYYRL